MFGPEFLEKERGRHTEACRRKRAVAGVLPGLQAHHVAMCGDGALVVVGGGAFSDELDETNYSALRSEDGGATWHVACARGPWAVHSQPVGLVASGGAIFVVCRRHVWRSEDGGYNWALFATVGAMRVDLSAACISKNSLVAIGCSHPTIGRVLSFDASSAAGSVCRVECAVAEWSNSISQSPIFIACGDTLVLISGLPIDTCFSAWGCSPILVVEVWHSSDGGMSWQEACKFAPNDIRSRVLAPRCATALDDATILMVSNMVSRSADKGRTWALVHRHVPWIPRRGAAMCATSASSVFFCGGSNANHLMRVPAFDDSWTSDDGGRTWDPLAGGPSSACDMDMRIALACMYPDRADDAKDAFLVDPSPFGKNLVMLAIECGNTRALAHLRVAWEDRIRAKSGTPAGASALN
jgi:hypothetical protein